MVSPEFRTEGAVLAEVEWLYVRVTLVAWDKKTADHLCREQLQGGTLQ